MAISGEMPRLPLTSSERVVRGRGRPRDSWSGDRRYKSGGQRFLRADCDVTGLYRFLRKKTAFSSPVRTPTYSSLPAARSRISSRSAARKS